ncbi:MAG: TlpA disulfide reductase family protein [Sedimentisphaerales bacterium]|jgi:thiol-disulfide isomerase/thioredoxin|nr:TlpA disulfide reductase family protein [Sedimentisphaerales bacterium]HNY80230.1 TlpA disulfide reductase family protein [Sedimentisphaerales bacterium]HOC63760.1 TlpA disulfide reductase family protein [Sedimentisphaerales bacterium]HOH65918.1 TlpA disulfide reductase family protein [Sedimentisphaerales bacterium]HPY50732.1 TlpA disulfide reductase family protein [Sedimentisphaerales bacterium]
MKTQIGIILLSLAVLAGCGKKDDGTQANQNQEQTPSAPTVSTPETAADMGSQAATTVMAAIPTKLGDAAYPLTGLTWVKGSPVTISPGKVYVVEFWATWCQPCRKSIPHLTELAKKYADRVVFVGVSNEDVATVKPFVADQGDQMAYNVAVDTAGKVINGYMAAFGQGGIPTAFIVDAAGKVVWLGHPMDNLDEVLDKVLAGTYTTAG